MSSLQTKLIVGQALLPKLSQSYTVHILDIAPKPSNLPSSVIYHRGSILPPSNAFPSLFTTYSWSGIIHLAAISLDSWCATKEIECKAVNEGGVKALYGQMDTLTQKRGLFKKNLPWVIYASSMDAVGPNARHEKSRAKPETALGRTKLSGEKVFEAMYEKTKSNGKHMLHAAILRFADVYGYDESTSIPQAFVPSTFMDAMTSRPIQYNSDAPPMDLLHVDDAVEGVLKSISRIVDSVDAGKMAKLEHIHLVAGKSWTPRDLVERVTASVDSKSPLRDLGSGRSSIEHEYSNSHAKAVLDWHPEITLREGIQRALLSFTDSMTEYSESYRAKTCGGSTPAPADMRNRDLHKLSGCTVNLVFDHEGFMHHLKCEDGKHCTADGEKVNGYNWNATTWKVHHTGTKIKDRRATIAFEEENGHGWLGVHQDQAKDYHEVGFELFDRDAPHRPAFFDFDVEVGDLLNELIPGCTR